MQFKYRPMLALAIFILQRQLHLNSGEGQDVHAHNQTVKEQIVKDHNVKDHNVKGQNVKDQDVKDQNVKKGPRCEVPQRTRLQCTFNLSRKQTWRE